MKIVKNFVVPVILISLAASGIIFLLFKMGTFDALELKTLDLRFITRGEREYKNENARDVVKIVGIDAKSIEEVGRWPWPRGVIGELVYGICGDGGMGVGSDSDAGWEDAGDDEGWEDAPDDEGWEDVPGEESVETGDAAGTADDNGTAQAEEESTETAKPIGKHRVAGIDILFDRAERDYSKYLYRKGSMMDPAQQDAMAVEALDLCDSVVQISLLKWADEGVNVGRGDRSAEHVMNGAKVIYNTPLPNFRTPNSSLGTANMQPSRFDERVRKARMYYKFDNEEGYIYPFALASLASFLGVDQKDIIVREGKYVRVGEYTIPVDKNGDIYINYRGKEYEPDKDGNVNKDNILSALDVMQTPEMIPMMMQGNYIFLVGVTDPDIKDIFYTPFAQAQSTYPNNAILNGIEIHKAIIDTILQGDYLHDVSPATVFIFIFAAAAVVTILTLIRLWLGALGMVAIGAAHFYYAVTAFNSSGAIYPVFSVIIVLPVCSLRRFSIAISSSTKRKTVLKKRSEVMSRRTCSPN